MHRDVEQILFPSSGVASFLSCDLFLLVFPSVLPSPATSLPSAPHVLRLEKLKEVIYCPVQTGLHLRTSHLEVIFPLVVLELLHNPPGKATALGRDEGCAGNSCQEQPLEPPQDQIGYCGKRGGKGAGLGLIISVPRGFWGLLTPCVPVKCVLWGQRRENP